LVGRPKRTLSRTTVSQEDALWFLSLPDKVRRNHFSIEEQSILAGRLNCESVILDAADEVLYRLGGAQANRSLPSLQDSYSSQSSVQSVDTSHFQESDDTMDDAMMESFRWLDDDLDLSLDDYHVYISETANSLDDYHGHISETAKPENEPSSLPHPRADLKRNLSLSNLPRSPRPSVGLNRAPMPPLPPMPITASQRTNGVHHLHKANLSPLTTTFNTESGTAHYNDPQTRLKLRIFASPQKFDEAIEFGFPSLTSIQRPSSGPHSRHASYWKGHARSNTNPGPHTFFDDDCPSSFKTYADDETASSHDTDFPDTPPAPSLREKYKPRIVKPSFDAERPHVWNAQTEPYAHAWLGNREMTLRMTLTRPDLRADDNLLYPATKSQPAPITLSDLHNAGDGDPWTKDPKEGGRVKRFWQRVGRKSNDSKDVNSLSEVKADSTANSPAGIKVSSEISISPLEDSDESIYFSTVDERSPWEKFGDFDSPVMAGYDHRRPREFARQASSSSGTLKPTQSRDGREPSRERRRREKSPDSRGDAEAQPFAIGYDCRITAGRAGQSPPTKSPTDRSLSGRKKEEKVPWGAVGGMDIPGFGFKVNAGW
jgi:hypothetical protein